MKLKRSIFNEYTGESKVTLNHHGEDYTGFALLHPNDWVNASKYAGCRLAEKRAHIKYLKKKRDEARLKRDALISFYKDLNYYFNSTVARRLKLIGDSVSTPPAAEVSMLARSTPMLTRASATA